MRWRQWSPPKGAAYRPNHELAIALAAGVALGAAGVGGIERAIPGRRPITLSISARLPTLKASKRSPPSPPRKSWLGSAASLWSGARTSPPSKACAPKRFVVIAFDTPEHAKAWSEQPGPEGNSREDGEVAVVHRRRPGAVLGERWPGSLPSRPPEIGLQLSRFVLEHRPDDFGRSLPGGEHCRKADRGSGFRRARRSAPSAPSRSGRRRRGRSQPNRSRPSTSRRARRRCRGCSAPGP